jgi:integrase
MPSDRIPRLRPHRTGGSVVSLAGEDHYCGPYGSAEAATRYDELVARWLAGGRRPLGPMPRRRRRRGEATISDLVAGYREHAATYYRKAAEGGGTRPTSRYVRVALDDLDRLAGGAAVLAFTRDDLLALRGYWVRAKGLGRRTVNQYVGVVKGCLRWGCDGRLVPASVLAEVLTVRALPAGRSEAPEGTERGPAPAEAVAAVLADPRLGRPVAALVRLQRTTGLRSSEVLAIRGAYVDRSGPVWAYRVPAWADKTERSRRGKVVYLGPAAQAVLAPWLDDAPGPAAPPWLTKRGRPYTEGPYRRAVVASCRRVGCEVWTPHQLRKARGQEVRERDGAEAAAVALGHARVDTTLAHYARHNDPLARRVAEETG